MQPWQIKTLEMEQTALKHLDGVLAGYELVIPIGIIYLLIILGVCLILLLRCGQRKWRVRPVIFIQMPGPPPRQADTFGPFPPHYTTHCDCNDDWD
jgi:hypothetical protein